MEPHYACFLTWRTYGTWLPGDERGWVSRDRNAYGEATNRPDHRLEAAMKGLLKGPPVTLDRGRRDLVDTALREACAFRNWPVAALNVRSNHVHLVVTPDCSPDQAMTALKARTTRVLRECGVLKSDERLWARGGSERLLRNEAAFHATVDYVLNRQ